MQNIVKINNHKIILGSRSPRRQELLKQMGISFEVVVKETNEDYLTTLKAEQIAVYLSEKKAQAFNDLDDETILITADTIVWLNSRVINKPENVEDAYKILNELSGQMHQVFTGVFLKKRNKIHSFFAETKVFFKPLEEDEINFYINQHQPFDKAGSYGIQEWIGYIGIERIEGSYFNVMGLPTQKLYLELNKFVENWGNE